MSYIDLRTVAILTGLSMLVLGFMLLGVRRYFPPTIQGLSQWGIAPIFCSLAAVFYAMSGRIPEALVVVLGDGLLLLGSVYYYVGSRYFFGFSVNRWLPGGVVLATLMVLLLFLWVIPDYRLRQFTFNMVMAGIAFANGRVLLARQVDWMTRFVGIVVAASCAVQVLRGVATFWVDAPDSTRFTSDSPIHAAYFLMYTVTGVILAAGVLFLASARLGREFKHLAHHDTLTGIKNRRAWLDIASRDMHLAQQNKQPLSLLLLDIDHFKKINDQHGHQAGDAALVRFTRAVQSVLRRTDSLGRFGGEEFVVLLPDTDVTAARATAERIQQALVDLPSDMSSPRLTTSIGIACTNDPEVDIDTLLGKADAALYRAKETGRNRAIVADWV